MPSPETIAEFARWWGTEFKGVMCPPCPTKASDLSFTAQMHLRESNATLFQNLFGNGGSGSAPMPADTVARRNQGRCIAADIPFLEAAGLQREANDLKRVAELQETQTHQPANRRKPTAAGDGCTAHEGMAKQGLFGALRSRTT